MRKGSTGRLLLPVHQAPIEKEEPGGRRFWAAARQFGAISCFALLAACAVGPDYQTPGLDLPAKWSNTTRQTPPAAPQLADWWLKLGDPDLDLLIEEAVKGNLDVRTAKAKIREARATYRQTGATLYPAVDGSGQAIRSKSASSGGSSSSVSNLFQAGLDASWELDLFGGNRRSVEAARYGLDAADEELRASLLTLIGDVADNYVQARGYQARIALAQSTARSQRETARLTKTKYDAGATSAVDVANAEGQASSTEANIPTLRTAYAEAVHRLSVLTGREPAALTKRLEKSRRIPKPAIRTAVGVPAHVLLARPDVRLAERQLAQATAKIGEAQAARYPAVSLTGSIATSAVKPGDLAKNSSISWSFGPTLSVPIFNAGELAAAVDVSKAQRDQYFLAYKAAVLGALEDVENALVGLSQEGRRVKSLDASVAAYKKASDFSNSLYRSGEVSFLDVLDAERSLYSAEDSRIQSRVQVVSYYIALNKALGGGWDGEVDSSTPEVADQNDGPRLALGKKK